MYRCSGRAKNFLMELIKQVDEKIIMHSFVLIGGMCNEA
jgi:hypothetical protein